VGVSSAEAVRRDVVLEGADHLRAAGAGAILLGFHLGSPRTWFRLRALGYPVRLAGRLEASVHDPRWAEALAARDAVRLPDGTPRDRLAGLYQIRDLLRGGALVFLTADGPFGREAFRLDLPGGPLIVRTGWLALRETGPHPPVWASGRQGSRRRRPPSLPPPDATRAGLPRAGDPGSPGRGIRPGRLTSADLAAAVPSPQPAAGRCSRFNDVSRAVTLLWAREVNRRGDDEFGDLEASLDAGEGVLVSVQAGPGPQALSPRAARRPRDAGVSLRRRPGPDSRGSTAPPGSGTIVERRGHRWPALAASGRGVAGPADRAASGDRRPPGSGWAPQTPYRDDLGLMGGGLGVRTFPSRLPTRRSSWSTTSSTRAGRSGRRSMRSSTSGARA
jgi:hypothetical protein